MQCRSFFIKPRFHSPDHRPPRGFFKIEIDSHHIILIQFSSSTYMDSDRHMNDQRRDLRAIESLIPFLGGCIYFYFGIFLLSFIYLIFDSLVIK